MEISQRAGELMARKIFGQASREDLEELDALTRENAEMQNILENLEELINNSILDSKRSKEAEIKKRNKLNELILKAKKTSKGPSNKAIVNNDDDTPTKAIGLSRKIRFQLKHLFFNRYFKYAAICILAFSVFFIWKSQKPAKLPRTAVSNESKVNETITIRAENGTRTSAMLPDGTKIWLNSGSSVLYNKRYNTKIREVFLVGEAYFDVVGNPSKPFIVHANDIDIKVLGTVFNVKSYDTDSSIETTLLKGSVEITNHFNKANKVLLKPNEKIVIQKKYNVYQVQKSKVLIDTVNDLNENATRILEFEKNKIGVVNDETAWLYHRLNFRNESFASLGFALKDGIM
jgi:hypothetical protein